jgi:sterol desaturase/sphingolipid hydroxylase (fatty acid hydroxylase superfamily)
VLSCSGRFLAGCVMDILNSIIAIFDLRTALILALIFIPLERLLTLHAEQKTVRKHLTTDLVYMFFIGQVTRLGLAAVLVAVMLGIRLVVPPALQAAVQSQPLVLQFIEAMIAADICLYIAHRAFHAVPFLWRFHAIHHSSEELDWLSAYRVHPLDQVATKAFSLLPVFALGFSTEAVVILFAMQQIHSLAVHANVKLNLGPLNWLLVTPQFHHWHHANEKSAYDKNFAAQLPIIDWLGGTMHLPDNAYPKVYGVDSAPPADNPLRQFADPFLGPHRPAPAKDASAEQPSRHAAE